MDKKGGFGFQHLIIGLNYADDMYMISGFLDHILQAGWFLVPGYFPDYLIGGFK